MSTATCIVGIGVVESPEPMTQLSHKELLFQATRKAMDDAGIEREDIGGAITSSYDFLEGRSLSNQYTLDSIGGVMKPCDLRLGEDGIYNLFAGWMEVMVDPSQVMVLASVQKASERDREGVGYQKVLADSMEPVFSRPVCKAVPNILGLESVLAAMDARAFFHRTGLKEDDLAKVVIKNLGNSGFKGKNPDIKEILKSDMLSWPIRSMFKAREADAACAIILTSEKKAKSMKGEPVFVRGIGWCSDKSHFASRDQGVSRETRWAAQQAYDMAGIRRPDREIDFAEISDWYAHRELIHCEALGFCRSDEIKGCLADGNFESGGRLPVNLSGGLLGRGNVIGTSGLIRVAQVVERIRGRTRGIHSQEAEVGLAHSWSGLPISASGVAILSKW